MTAATTDGANPQGLRERKKRRTRDALIDAAYNLVIGQGYEATTVDQIADAVEVSPRTFFRYFGSKEDVVLDLQDRIWDAVHESFENQPPELPVVAAIRAAMSEVLDRMEGGGFGITVERL